ncbi:MAG: SRPBCC domain-containing protein [Parvularcula sp.]|jgi:uncharacterized protein YndB with AHSA1/START domain|nr:SRPBCC domain-containing protein [Parvularcula sp.]
MIDNDKSMRALDFERVLQHPPEKVWRALTQPHLLGEWLMQSDFEAKTGAAFTMAAEWGKVTGIVIAVESERRLSYTWNGPGLTSEITWTLTPRGSGTLLRLDHREIPAESQQAYHGAKSGWPRFLDALEATLAEGAG